MNDMEIYFYQADCGDAARICYLGNDDFFHNVLIDSGRSKTFRHILIEQIKGIKSKEEYIDLWITSHIHDDHIGGIVKYIKAVQSGEIQDIVKRWFYNPPRIAVKTSIDDQSRISSPVSIKQGDLLSQYLEETQQFPQEDIVNLHTENLYGLEITVLSPSKEKLNELRTKYKDEDVQLERIENESISIPISVSNNDYLKSIDSFDLNKWTEDKSVENGSSISVITEFQGKRVLWLADAHPSDIVSSLKELGYSASNKIECEWVKVAHHGSKGNSSDELYSMIECSNYLFSANGENRDYLPNKEAIVRILRNSNRDMENKYNIVFTYDNDTLRSIFSIDGAETFEKWNFEVRYPSSEKFIKIVL